MESWKWEKNPILHRDGVGMVMVLSTNGANRLVEIVDSPAPEEEADALKACAAVRIK